MSVSIEINVIRLDWIAAFATMKRSFINIVIPVKTSIQRLNIASPNTCGG
jgi:hypothetical protein